MQPIALKARTQEKIETTAAVKSNEDRIKSIVSVELVNLGDVNHILSDLQTRRVVPIDRRGYITIKCNQGEVVEVNLKSFESMRKFLKVDIANEINLHDFDVNIIKILEPFLSGDTKKIEELLGDSNRPEILTEFYRLLEFFFLNNEEYSNFKAVYKFFENLVTEMGINPSNFSYPKYKNVLQIAFLSGQLIGKMERYFRYLVDHHQSGDDFVVQFFLKASLYNEEYLVKIFKEEKNFYPAYKFKLLKILTNNRDLKELEELHQLAQRCTENQDAHLEALKKEMEVLFDPIQDISISKNGLVEFYQKLKELIDKVSYPCTSLNLAAERTLEKSLLNVANLLENFQKCILQLIEKGPNIPLNQLLKQIIEENGLTQKLHQRVTAGKEHFNTSTQNIHLRSKILEK
jgi:hypothetical protein